MSHILNKHLKKKKNLKQDLISKNYNGKKKFRKITTLILVIDNQLEFEISCTITETTQ